MNKIIKNFKDIKYGPAPEDDREVMKWIKNLPKPNHNFINGEWSKSKTKKTLRSINPANNKKLFDEKVIASFSLLIKYYLFNKKTYHKL